MAQGRVREYMTELLLYALVCAPLCAQLLMTGIGQSVLFLFLAFAFPFLIDRSSNVLGALLARISGFPAAWLAAGCPEDGRRVGLARTLIPESPPLPFLFQRPPPFWLDSTQLTGCTEPRHRPVRGFAYSSGWLRASEEGSSACSLSNHCPVHRMF